MSFPLGDWVLDHEGVPHDLAQSGMKGELRTIEPLLRTATARDPPELRLRLGQLHGVPSSQVILTPGATSANGLVLLYLARALRRTTTRTPRAGLPVPEYPPLWDVAAAAGFRTRAGFPGCDLAVLSNPSNPEGGRRSDDELLSATGDAQVRLVDETFREFTTAPSLARCRDPTTWTTGTLTKAYGADHLRVGWVIAPAHEATKFRDMCELWADKLSYLSVGAALAVLDRRAAILGETRRIFDRNQEELRQRVPGVPRLFGPIWFDRRPLDEGTEPFARRALRRGVLVCPGHFFRDPRGIRLCLTRQSFAKDLDAYLQLRGRPRQGGAR